MLDIPTKIKYTKYKLTEEKRILLLHFAFLLSDAGNPPSVCLRQIKSKLT